MAKTLKEHLMQQESQWLTAYTDWGRDTDDNSIPYGIKRIVDYDKLIAEIDAFSKTFQKVKK